MCKTRLGSQGVILDGFSAKNEKTLMELESPPPPFMENSIKNFHFVCRITPQSTNQYRLILTQRLQVPTSTALCWPSATKYQPVFERISTWRSLLNLMSY